jgi:CCR4-NOT transcription complex subunit 1
MIHTILDEYRFFDRYPERELMLTGKLFGGVIQHRLLTLKTLGVALR